jgi:hypothetical protein
MRPFRVVALAGAAGSGKDTAADYLVKQYGYARYAFAGPLKAALNAMFGWTMAMWNDREWKERVLSDVGKSPRQMAQTLGTEWGRELVNRDLWMMLAARAVSSAHINGFDGIVFTDCRFANEAEFVLAQSGFVLQIVRPGVSAVSAHVSEKTLPAHLISSTIVNDSSMAHLWGRIGEFAEAT